VAAASDIVRGVYVAGGTKVNPIILTDSSLWVPIWRAKSKGFRAKLATRCYNTVRAVAGEPTAGCKFRPDPFR
jgi:hypothetical protein